MKQISESSGGISVSLIQGSGGVLIKVVEKMEAVWEVSGRTLIRYTGDDREIIIPDGVSEIAGNAFRGNKKITSVNIPNRIEKIGRRAFSGCTALQTVQIADIHIIDIYAFAGCTSLEDIFLPDNTMVSITYGAFKGCTSLKKCRVPEGVRKISPGAFCKCWGLEKVSLPATLKKIGKYAFSKCARLKEVRLVSAHTDIHPTAFHKCNPDILFEWETKEANPGAARDGFDIDSSGTLISYFGRKPEVRIPDGVVAVGWNCFGSNTSVKTLITPASLKTLGRHSLAWSSAEQVCLTGVETIEDDAFWASKLISIELPQSLISIGSDAFGQCHYLKKLEFKNPGTVFQGRIAPMAYALETVVLPEGIEEIPGGAFYYCESLRDIRIPETVKHIANGAFQGCQSLREMAIPKTVKTLDWNVFRSCKNLREVVLQGEETLITGRNDEFCTASARHANQPRVKTMVIFMGPHRSGKTFYFNWHFAGKFIHVHSDEDQAGSEEQKLIQECLDKGDDFVIDDTNNTKAGRAVYIQNAKAAGYRIIGYLFRTQISDQYIQFDRNFRPEQRYSEIMPADLSQLELPDCSEGFDELYYVEMMGSYHHEGDTNAMVKRDWSDALQDESR